MALTRRGIFKVAVAAAAVPALALTGLASASAVRHRQRYLLVHGSWHGGWCWRDVARILRLAGHDVYTPTLTGLGERAHLLSRATSLDMHIEDVSNVIRCDELDDVIIVGHSYSGVVITGVCDRFRERIRHAVYIDAASPANGDSNGGGRSIEQLRKDFGLAADASVIEPSDAVLGLLGIGPGDGDKFDWLKRRLTPHPLRTWVDKLQLVNGGSTGLPRTFVFCNNAEATSPIRHYANKLRKDASWSFRELPCGHDAMVILPQQTADTLMSIGIAHK